MKIKITPRQYDALYNDKEPPPAAALHLATPQQSTKAPKPKGMGNPFVNLTTTTSRP